MIEKAVLIADNYDRIDGTNAYSSDIKQLTIGAPQLERNAATSIAAQIWKQDKNGELKISTEIPIHQVMDLMIVVSRTLLHFREAYRFPLLYDPEHPVIERIGLQGSVMPIAVCTDNPNINEDMKALSQSLNDIGELIGERLRVLERILEEME